jgi:MFS superfamily sulfate permease-like transporter
MLITTAAILWLDVQNGLFVGMGVSVLAVLFRVFRPRVRELARLPHTDVFVAMERYPEARRCCYRCLHDHVHSFLLLYRIPPSPLQPLYSSRSLATGSVSAFASFAWMGLSCSVTFVLLWTCCAQCCPIILRRTPSQLPPCLGRHRDLRLAKRGRRVVPLNHQLQQQVRAPLCVLLAPCLFFALGDGGCVCAVRCSSPRHGRSNASPLGA